MTYADLSDFLDDDGLTVTLRGKEYLIPSPDAEKGLQLAAMANIGVKAKLGQDITEEQMRSIQIDTEGKDFIRFVLTDAVVDQMIVDGISWVALSRVAQYAFTHFALNPETARKALEAGMFAGKAPAPTNRAGRRAASTEAPKARPASPGSSPRTKRATSGGASGARGRS